MGAPHRSFTRGALTDFKKALKECREKAVDLQFEFNEFETTLLLCKVFGGLDNMDQVHGEWLVKEACDRDTVKKCFDHFDPAFLQECRLKQALGITDLSVPESAWQ